ncbi:MAG: hypothetical protein BGO90_14140 [Legionella sp. 40-6]|nr:hypothetical protein [Legionella sp.]OJY11430.1 MAG: hypothetical protein BGO90_14140 [Legionella sp. 40-6]
MGLWKPQEEDEIKVKAWAQIQYERFVAANKGKNLFLEVIANNYERGNYPSSNFILKIISNESLNKIILTLLLVAGLTALIMGGLGVTGLIVGFTGSAAATTAIAGALVSGIASSALIRRFSFFAGKKFARFEEENNFLIGHQVN